MIPRFLSKESGFYSRVHSRCSFLQIPESSAGRISLFSLPQDPEFLPPRAHVLPPSSLSRSYIIPKPTSVSVVFSINETDDTDRSLMQVFLLEFSEAKRTVAGSPSVTFSRDEPNDLHGMVKEKPSVGFLSFGMGFEGWRMDCSLQRRKCGGESRREGRGAAQLLPLLSGLPCEVE